MAYLDESGLSRLWNHIMTKLGGKYSKPADGIPASDLNAAVQTSLTKADTAIQSLDGYATETFVENKVADLVNSAPETLDTLGELAAAFENNQEVVEALDGAISNKVDKEEGKGLSSNDFTTAEKEKLAGLNKITVDTSVNSYSANPVENKAVYEAINEPKRQMLLKDVYQDIFVLEMKDNSLTSEKIPYQVDILPLERFTFTTSETFTIDDCPEVEGNFYREGKVNMKDKARFVLMVPPNHTSGYVIHKNSSYSFYGKDTGDYKLVIEYDPPAISFATTSQSYYITVIEPQQTVIFDDTFYYAPWEEEGGDGSFSTVPNITSYDPNKEYIIYTDALSGEMTAYPATLYYDEYNNYYRFDTDYIYEPNNELDLQLSIYYNVNPNSAYASISTRGGGDPYIGLSGSVQIAEIIKPVSEIFFQNDNLVVQGNGYVHFMDTFTIPKSEIPKRFTAIYELEIEGEKIKETSTFIYDDSTKTWKDSNGAEFQWISDNYSRLYLNAYLGSTISIAFKTIV